MRWLCGLALCLAAACTDRPARNPLDPRATGVDPSVALRPLEAVAGDGQVQLRWDFRNFGDLNGYRLYRRAGDAPLTAHLDLGPGDTTFVDPGVVNGETYGYQLALLVQGEGERRIEPLRQATPGPQSGWVADPGSGLVWRITPDNRAAFFGQGRFPGLAGIGVDLRDGSCWVSDEFYAGAIRIDAEGQLSSHPGQVERPGPLAIDPASGEGWLADLARQTVLHFPLPPGEDSLRFETVDARFAGLSLVEAAEGGCWIGDGGRVMRYWHQDRRRREWAVTEATALAPTGQGGAWALVRGGQGLVYLEPGGGVSELPSPFATSFALEFDRRSGYCWVAGTTGLVALDTQGGEVIRVEDLGECRALAVDFRRQEVWVAGAGQLLKVSATGRLLARLGGFALLGGIEMDLGDPR